MPCKTYRWCPACTRNHKLIRVKESSPPRPVYESCFVPNSGGGSGGGISSWASHPTVECGDCGYGISGSVMTLQTSPPMWQCPGCNKHNKFG